MCLLLLDYERHCKQQYVARTHFNGNRDRCTSILAHQRPILSRCGSQIRQKPPQLRASFARYKHQPTAFLASLRGPQTMSSAHALPIPAITAVPYTRSLSPELAPPPPPPSTRPPPSPFPPSPLFFTLHPSSLSSSTLHPLHPLHPLCPFPSPPPPPISALSTLLPPPFPPPSPISAPSPSPHLYLPQCRSLFSQLQFDRPKNEGLQMK